MKTVYVLVIQPISDDELERIAADSPKFSGAAAEARIDSRPR